MDYGVLNIIFVFFIGFVGSFIGSVAAGAALITVPGLLLLGLPPHIALATSRFGSLGFKFGSLVQYVKHNIMIKDLIVPMSIMGVVGAALGARILVEINTEFLSKVVGILLIALLPVLFLRKDVGIVHKQISKAKRFFAHLLYFLVKLWGGFFSPGSGFLGTYVTLNAYGLTILEGKGTTRIPDVLATLSAITVFALAGIIDYKVGIVLLIGMLIGGYVGAHVAIKKGDAWIKPVIAVFIIIVSSKLIFFS